MNPPIQFLEQFTRENISVRNKLLAVFTICLIVSSTFSIIANYILGLSTEINSVVISLISINAITLYLAYKNKIKHRGRFIYFMIMATFLPFAWIFNGGITGSIPMHFFTYLTGSVLILSNYYRIGLLSYLHVLALIALMIEFKYPDIIHPYRSESAKAVDITISFIQVSLSIIALATTFTRINYTYQRKLINNKEKLNRSYTELSAAKEKAEKATIAKSNFITNISHEIRTPLHAIVGITDLLKQNESNQEQMVLLSSLQSSSKTLSDLAKDLLDLSKIEANKMTVNNEIFDIRKTIREVESLIHTQIIEKKIVLECIIEEDVPLLIDMDRIKYKQVLINLLSNAGKFTLTGSIKCIVNYDADKKSLITHIKDTGIGIDNKKIKQLFTPFTQLNTDYNTENIGIGMGLAISKNMIELMAGKIRVESIIDVGTTFIFTIPVKNTKKIIEKTALMNSESQKDIALNSKASFHILIAEDNKINQIVLSKMLERLNHKFDIVNNGQDAVNIAKKKKYDIILMDIQMPIKNGIDAANEIYTYYQEQNKKGPTIIGCSANIIPQESNSSVRNNMQDYLTKPISLDDLANKLNTIEI